MSNMHFRARKVRLLVSLSRCSRTLERIWKTPYHCHPTTMFQGNLQPWSFLQWPQCRGSLQNASVWYRCHREQRAHYKHKSDCTAFGYGNVIFGGHPASSFFHHCLGTVSPCHVVYTESESLCDWIRSPSITQFFQAVQTSSAAMQFLYSILIAQYYICVR